MSERIFCVWMDNKTDRRDSLPIKVRAASKAAAREIASDYSPWRFSVGTAYTLSEFSKATGWTHTWAEPFNYERPKKKKRRRK